MRTTDPTETAASGAAVVTEPSSADIDIDAPPTSRTPHGGSEAGMTTAEYAVGTVAACAFAGVLFKVVTSHGVASLLTSLVRRALSVSL